MMNKQTFISLIKKPDLKHGHWRLSAWIFASKHLVNIYDTIKLLFFSINKLSKQCLNFPKLIFFMSFSPGFTFFMSLVTYLQCNVWILQVVKPSLSAIVLLLKEKLLRKCYFDEDFVINLFDATLFTRTLMNKSYCVLKSHKYF